MTVKTLLLFEVSLLGAVLGSFLALVTFRLPRGESVVSPRSHCRHCRRVLAWYDNIPLLSYLLLRARCRHCRHTISPRYFCIEALSTLMTLGAFEALRPWPRFFLYLFSFLLPLLALIVIDWEHLLLPDSLTVSGMILGVLVYVVDRKYFLSAEWIKPAVLSSVDFLAAGKAVSSSVPVLLSESGLGLAAGGLTLWALAVLYRKLRHREGLGGGDIKLAAMLGAFLGWKPIFLIFFVASWLGILLGLGLMVFRRRSSQTPLPFGTCLGLAAIAYLFYGAPWLESYLRWISKLNN